VAVFFSVMDIVVVGGGLAGTATAYFLKKEHAALIKSITIVERLDKPLGQLTSSRSTECYRNAWRTNRENPQKRCCLSLTFSALFWRPAEPVMMAFVNHSISLLEEMDRASNGAFEMNRPGYLFVTSKADNTYSDQGKYAESIGIGTFREHTADISKYKAAPGTTRIFHDQTLLDLNGADVIKRKEDLHALYSFLGDDIVAGKHVRKCGWITVQSLIDWMCASSGATVKHDSVVELKPTDTGVSVLLASGEALEVNKVVLAVGPHLVNLSSLVKHDLGYSMPLINEIHAKVVINDVEGVVPESSPLVHLDDDVLLEWSAEQREFISSRPELAYLLHPIRYGAHFRPGPVGSKVRLSLATHFKRVLNLLISFSGVVGYLDVPRGFSNRKSRASSTFSDRR
jgi:glycine/D-amino acid oxidase-like deaminating enzyme